MFRYVHKVVFMIIDTFTMYITPLLLFVEKLRGGVSINSPIESDIKIRSFVEKKGEEKISISNVSD